MLILAQFRLQTLTLKNTKKTGADIAGLDLQVTLLKDHGKNVNLIFRGTRTLCTVHYIAWAQKKSLNL